MREYSQDDMNRIRTYHDKMVEGSEGDETIDDITWNDLDMDSIFSMICSTKSVVGEEYLYHMLRTPAGNLEDLSERLRLKNFFRDNTDAINRISGILSKLPWLKKYSLTKLLYECLSINEGSNVPHYLLDVLIILSFALIFVYPSWGVLIFVILLAWGIISYFRTKALIDPYVCTLIYVLDMLKASEKIIKCDYSELSKETGCLKAVNEGFGTFSRNTFVLSTALHTTDNPIDLLLDYVRMIFHVDIIKFNSMLKVLKSHIDDIEELRKILGSLDAAVSLATFEADNVSFHEPELDAGCSRIEVKEAFHPLLKDPVKLNFSSDTSILVTGSNASGKSTFLKTMAILALLGQSIGLVNATSYKAGFYRIFSSMSLRDSIIGGDSYYMVEIKSIKRILDAKVSGKLPILCFVDEVLRGTNTVERIAASAEILKSLNASGVLCFAATHDIELTYILEEEYENYHFEEQIDEDDIRFDYVLKAGRGNSRNAIGLLSVLGYDEDIVTRAKERADSYLKCGTWITN